MGRSLLKQCSSTPVDLTSDGEGEELRACKQSSIGGLRSNATISHLRLKG